MPRAKDVIVYCADAMVASCVVTAARLHSGIRVVGVSSAVELEAAISEARGRDRMGCMIAIRSYPDTRFKEVFDLLIGLSPVLEVLNGATKDALSFADRRTYGLLDMESVVYAMKVLCVRRGGPKQRSREVA